MSVKIVNDHVKMATGRDVSLRKWKGRSSTMKLFENYKQIHWWAAFDTKEMEIQRRERIQNVLSETQILPFPPTPGFMANSNLGLIKCCSSQNFSHHFGVVHVMENAWLCMTFFEMQNLVALSSWHRFGHRPSGLTSIWQLGFDVQIYAAALPHSI